MLLRALEKLSDGDDDITVAQLSLDEIKVEVSEAGHLANQTVERLIRDGAITAQMATSLMNDSAYAAEAMQCLLQTTESLFIAAAPATTAQSDVALSQEEIDEIAHDLAKSAHDPRNGGQ
jgi:phosphate:Na+ symporter